MIEETLLQKKRQLNESSWLESITISKQFKNSCISIIRKALSTLCNNRGWGVEDPVEYVILECASFSGSTVSQIVVTISDLERILLPLEDHLFIETIEDVAHTFYEKKYSIYNELESDFNAIFKRQSLPFKCNAGQFIDSEEQTMYDEIIAPCLSILSDNGFVTADTHLRDSFRKYHENENKESILKCGMALDSVIQKILVDHGLPLPNNDNDFHNKIKTLRDSGYLPDYCDENFANNLKELLHAPLKIRNNEPNVSHGKENDPSTDDDLVKYTVDLTCSSILYIVREYVKKH